MTGNEAIARGAFEAGVKVAAAYPGTPSTEILETIAREYKDIYAEWSPNEKVALEVAIGASLAGARTMASMKHVGVNVAADPLMTLSYVGVNGGLVLVTCDDPELYSSQNEQDNRHYARFAKIPMFEPSDSQEAKEFVKLGYEVSETFDTPGHGSGRHPDLSFERSGRVAGTGRFSSPYRDPETDCKIYDVAFFRPG